MVTASPHTSGLTPVAVPTDMASGMVVARKPVMLGISARSSAATTSRAATTKSGLPASAGTSRARCVATHALALAGDERARERERRGDHEQVGPAEALLEVVPGDDADAGGEQTDPRDQRGNHRMPVMARV